jgi:hypothetical protein
MNDSIANLIASQSNAGDNRALHRDVARIIYDTVFVPGEEVDDDIMPPFDEAQADETGGYVRAVEAAELVVSRIQRQQPA